MKTDDWIDPAAKTHRYKDGVVWVHDADRTLLLDDRGEILLAVGATDLVSRGWSDRAYGVAGTDSTQPFHARWPGGMIGFDADNRIYLADEAFHRVSRYALPWRPRDTPKGPALPEPDGGLFAGTLPNTVGPAHLHADRVGAVTFKNQLIVRDHQRYMVWNDYLKKPDGAPADLFIGQPDGTSLTERNHIMGRAMHAIDHKDRLWATGEHGRLMAYQLPFRGRGQAAPRTGPVALGGRAGQGGGLPRQPGHRLRAGDQVACGCSTTRTTACCGSGCRTTRPASCWSMPSSGRRTRRTEGEPGAGPAGRGQLRRRERRQVRPGRATCSWWTTPTSCTPTAASSPSWPTT